MRFSCYDWRPSRFHPEFTGIASRYSGLKNQRLSQQKRRIQLESDQTYTLNLDHSLDKNLQSKMLQLYNLQHTRKRQINDRKFKEQLNEERKMQLTSLRQRNNHVRLEGKRNRQEARRKLMEKKQQSRLRTNENLTALNGQLQKKLCKNHFQKSMKCRLVRQEEVQSQLKVNNYYRQKNQESVKQYSQRMAEQQRRRRDQQRRIKKYEKELKNINKTVEIKKTYLNQVQKEIQILKSNIKEVKVPNSKTKKFRVKLTQESEKSRKSQFKKQRQIQINPQNQQYA